MVPRAYSDKEDDLSKTLNKEACNLIKNSQDDCLRTRLNRESGRTELRVCVCSKSLCNAAGGRFGGGGGGGYVAAAAVAALASAIVTH